MSSNLPKITVSNDRVDTDNSIGVTRGKEGRGEAEKGEGGHVHCDSRFDSGR